MEHKYKGIVLNKKDVGETDRLYVLYTLEAGKIIASAKGVRKMKAKLNGALENFNLVEIFLAKNRGNGTITGALAEENFYQVKKNFDAMQNVFENLRLVESLVGWDDPDKRVFFELVEYLSTLDELLKKEKTEKIRLLGLAFRFRFLEISGYLLQKENCVFCGERIRAGGNFFSAAQGGLVCEKCRSGEQLLLPVEENAIKALRIFEKNSLSLIRKLSAQEKDLRNIKLILDEFIHFIK